MAGQGQNNTEELVRQIRALHTELDAIRSGLSSTLGDQSTAISDINAQLNRTVSAFKRIRNAQNLTLDKQTKQLKETKSLADVYKQIPDSLSGFKSRMMDTLSISEKLTASAKAASGAKKAELTAFASTYNQTLSLATELSSLNKEDTLERSIQNNEIEKSLNLLQTQADTYALINGTENETFRNLQKQIESLKNIVLESNSIANVSKEIKDVYGELYGDLDGLSKGFKKLAATIEVFFSSFKNVLGMSLMFAGELFDEFAQISKQIGGSVLQMTGFKAQVFAVSKLLGDDAGNAVAGLAEKLGNANDISTTLGFSVGAMSSRLGISGEETATLVNQFGNLKGLSSEVALDTMEAASQLAIANGVAPGAVMKDVAQNTEFFAKYSKNGGENIFQAAIEAKRLGVDLATAAEISDGLLDYQTSVAAEMEASVILNKNLNLQKARELAFAGDSAGAMKEAIKQAGTLAELEAMNPIEREALAKAIGVSSDKLVQMIANEKRALTPAGQLEAKFDAAGAVLTEMGTTVGGTILKGFGSVLMFTGQWSRLLTDTMNGPLGGIFSKIGQIGKAMLMLPAKGLNKLTGGALGRGFDKVKGFAGRLMGGGDATESISSRAGGREAQTAAGQKKLAGGFTAMGEPGVGKGILNTALAGPALFLLSLGTPGMIAIGKFGKSAGKGLQSLAPGVTAFGAVPFMATIMLAATGVGLLALTLGTPGMIAVTTLGASAGKGLTALSVGMMAFSTVPLLAAGVLAATGAAFAVMSLGSLGLAAIALGGVPAAAGLEALTVALTAMGVAAATGVPFLGIGLLAAFGAALIPLTTALSSLAPLVIAIGQSISLVFTTMANAFVTMEKSLPNLVENFLPLLAMIAPIFLLSTAIMALSISLLALGAASIVAMPALAVMGFAAGAGLGVANSVMGGGGEGGDSGLLAEMQGLRADIKNLAVVVSLDSRQIYKGQVQTVKNNS